MLFKLIINCRATRGREGVCHIFHNQPQFVGRRVKAPERGQVAHRPRAKFMQAGPDRPATTLLGAVPCTHGPSPAPDPP